MATYPSVPAPDYPIEERLYYDVITTDMAGTQATRVRHLTPTRTWILKYNAIHDGDCKYLWDFFNARRGNYEDFTFVHPETAVSYTARFADATLEREEIGHNLFNVSVTLTEVI